MSRKRSKPTRADSKLKNKVAKLIAVLKKEYPEADTELRHSNPLEMLVATILSAQCTDRQVNQVTKVLFKKYRSVSDWAKAPLKTLEREVHPTGFFRNKAKAIKDSAEDILSRFKGRVPSTLEELTSLALKGIRELTEIQQRALAKHPSAAARP